MKKSLLMIAAVLTAMLLQAKDHTIVVRTDQPTPKGNTEVKVEYAPGGDVITITPSKDVSTITVTVKDEYGQIVAEGDVPANTEGVYELSTPDTTEGNTIEVSDDYGVVHVEVE